MRLKDLIFLFIPVLVTCQEAKDTEIWGPVPEEVYTISDSAPPTDAIILFDGSDLSKWKPRWGKDKSEWQINKDGSVTCLLYTSPSPRDVHLSRMPSSA